MKRPDIENWTSHEEAEELARLAKGQLVLEVGSFAGFGTVLMALAGAQVWAVDWHRGDQDLGERDTLAYWWRNVRRYRVEDQVVGLVGRSEVVLPMLRERVFDLAFVDAYHAYEAVSQDIRLTLPLLRARGLLVCHDYCDRWPGVVRAVEELRGRPGTRLRVVGSLAVIETLLR